MFYRNFVSTYFIKSKQHYFEKELYGQEKYTHSQGLYGSELNFFHQQIGLGLPFSLLKTSLRIYKFTHFRLLSKLLIRVYTVSLTLIRSLDVRFSPTLENRTGIIKLTSNAGTRFHNTSKQR